MNYEGKDRAEPRAFPQLSESRYSQSLERGLAILACFNPERPVLGIAEIADSLGLSRSTTHRYVTTLVAQGYLQRNASRRYQLAFRALDLGMTTLNAIGLCKHAHPHLQTFADRSGCTVQIAVLDGLEILLLDTVERAQGNHRSAEPTVSIGSRLPAYCTSMGKVLLAHLPAGQLMSRISQMDLVKRGPKTITNKGMLSEQLEQILNEGIAVEDEEQEEGSHAIAAPVRDDSGDVVAAVGVACRDGASDLESLLDRFGGQIIVTAERISRQMGWQEATIDLDS